jgi:hypothetical protein
LPFHELFVIIYTLLFVHFLEYTGGELLTSDEKDALAAGRIML